MLLGMLLHWVVDTHSRHYPSMPANTHIPFISDIGAQKLKPLFITGSVLTTVLLDASFLSQRWLRHSGRLVPNRSLGEKILDILTIVFGLIGTAGLILLSIFDTYRHNKLHDIFLLLFIGGYLISAVFICWEYQRLGISKSQTLRLELTNELTLHAENREHAVLRISFWVKLTFILVELALAVAFGVSSRTHHHDIAAVFEWVVALIFTFYVLSFVLDLYPAVWTKEKNKRFAKPETGSPRNESILSEQPPVSQV